MRMLEIKRRQSVYPHINCTEGCKKRGSLLYCSVRVLNIYLLDRLWTVVALWVYMEVGIPPLHV